LKIYISQGRVAMQLRCGGIFRLYKLLYYKFSTECASEKFLKVGQYLAKIRKNLWLTSLAHPVDFAPLQSQAETIYKCSALISTRICCLNRRTNQRNRLQLPTTSR